MSLKQDFRSVWIALRQLSPVVVDVPAGVRRVLLQRYMEMSMRNGRLSLISFGILLFGLAYEAPLFPRLAAWALLAAIFGVRVWRVRRMQATFDAAEPRSDRTYDLLLLVASSFWGIAPIVLQGHISPFNLFAVMYAAFVAIALLTITYLAALPASLVLVSASIIPLVACMALQGSMVLVVLAAGTLMCTVALLMRVNSGHGTLLQALASELQNAALVQELQGYRHRLESENASLGSSLRDASHAASRDPLTGLYNRRYLAAFAAPLAETVRMHREDITVCVVDVDHFKRVNDHHGHPVGDEVLKAVANLLGTRLRDGDCLARYGGEEFVTVLRRCDVNRARRVAESLRHNVAGVEIDTDAGPVNATVSVGVAQWAAGESFDEVIHRADRALYQAKRSGRDRVEVDASDALRLLSVPQDSTLPGQLH